MASAALGRTTPCFALLVLFSSLLSLCSATRKLASLYVPPPETLAYHQGPLLEGQLSVSIFWYGKFSPSQKSIVSDFFLSLNPGKRGEGQSLSEAEHPSVSKWWQTVLSYLKDAGKKETRISLSGQVSDEGFLLGKSLKRAQIVELARRVNSKSVSLTLVLTAEDVAVEGFCMSSCGFHGSDRETKEVFIWVGNSASQCPGQCGWPFHQPIYGPQSQPLGAPNGDVGVDAMVVNIASILANTVTNPFGNGYYQGPADAPLEAASACSGVYGKGSYPGYAGELLVDSGSGASYNAEGVDGRKYLLPALVDPLTSRCWTLV
ncbi:hypothetical protein Nepgr_023696 [Nepenthes gracilis]|uniref:Uncharacterized protein n=1 Tax=Nepenthes gracilis TaxID=150966 RepID=A0AAD3XY32_NEPGR|nr:hypothetical protein Nepgr_023696 [Nepenthes gracilis]